jgi:hypothetical protein
MDPLFSELLMGTPGPGTLEVVARYLEDQEPAARLEVLRALGRGQQRALYQLAAHGPPISLDHFVPPSLAARTPVRHDGRNTLPLPGPFQRFEKRFARPVDGTARLFGYNEGLTRGPVGPGFFVAYPTTGHPEWEARGPVVIDYHLVPDGPVPGGWPEVVHNARGLQFFVYRGTRDFMRRVSTHVSIGAAYRGETSLDHYFVLCRLEESEAGKKEQA